MGFYHRPLSLCKLRGAEVSSAKCGATQHPGLKLESRHFLVLRKMGTDYMQTS